MFGSSSSIYHNFQISKRRRIDVIYGRIPQHKDRPILPIRLSSPSYPRLRPLLAIWLPHPLSPACEHVRFTVDVVRKIPRGELVDEEAWSGFRLGNFTSRLANPLIRTGQSSFKHAFLQALITRPPRSVTPFSQAQSLFGPCMSPPAFGRESLLYRP
jgi:hypothetical protein